jgi:hypothetical protein
MYRLLLFYSFCLFFLVSGGCTRSSTLLGNTSRSTLSIWGVHREINVLFGRSPDVERWNIHKLTSNTDMTLPDEHTGVVDGLGQSLFVNLRLKTAFQQLLGRKLKDGIEFQLIIREQTVTAHSSQHGGTLEDPLGVLWVKGQKGTGRLTKLGQGILDTPDFALAAESVLSHKS